MLGIKAGILPDYLKDKFTEQCIRPGKPRAREISGILRVEGFVHKTCSAIRITQLFQATAYFLRGIRRKSFHNDTHRPNVVQPHMGASHTFTSFAFKK